MPSDDHLAAVKSAAVTLDAVQRRVSEPSQAQTLSEAAEILGMYLQEAEGDDD